MVTRRAFLATTAGVLGAAAGAGLYTRFVEPEWLELTSRSLPIDRLPASLQGARLVQLSDIHIGPRVRDAYVRETFAQVRALSPDIVVITGDLVSWHDRMQVHAEQLYAEMPRGRLATVVTFGNHDYGPEWQDAAVAAGLRGMLQNLGATVLVNDVAEVGGLQVVGMGDLWAGMFDPVRAFSRVDPAAAQLVLSHNPDTVDLPGWGPFAGWVLAGHTHGGQCKAPFLPPPILPVKNKRYSSGEFALAGGRRLYINRGVGTYLPVRFNVRPEVTVFTLEASIPSGSA